MCAAPYGRPACTRLRDRTNPSLQPLQLQVRPPVLHAVSAALLMLGEVAEPPKAWRSLGPRLGKKDAQGNRLPWRGRLLRRLAAFDPLGMSEARVERVQALVDLLPQPQVERR